MQIKTSIRYIPIKIGKIRKLIRPSAGEFVGKLDLSCIASGNTMIILETEAVSYKVKYTLTIQLRDLAPRYIPKKTLSCNYLQMFIMTLFVIAPN